MTAIVVMGAPRSGVGLVGRMLKTAGASLAGEGLEKLNGYLLRLAGGNWQAPPPERAIWTAGEALRREIATVMAEYAGVATVWADVQTALTVDVFRARLVDAQYVIVRRDRDAAARGLMNEIESAPSDWLPVLAEYDERLTRFARLTKGHAPMLELRYEELVDPVTADGAVRRLVEFVGLGEEAVGAARAVVEPRETPRGFGRLGVGVPFFHGEFEFWQWWTLLLLGGFEAGDEILNHHDVPGEVLIPEAHNGVVRKFMQSDCDTLLMIEDDHVADQEVVRRMRFNPENWPYDVVCASYVNRRGVPRAIGCTFQQKPNEQGYLVHRDMRGVWLEGTQPVDVAALGLVFIRRQVLEAMLGDRDPSQFSWFNLIGRSSQDIDFYWRVKELGFQAAIDRNEWVGHVGKYTWGKEDFVGWLAAAEAFHREQANG